MSQNPLRLYTAFHLNMAYSSIEEKDRGELLERCYWPLLRLAKEKGLIFGIEATGFTLETIRELDPSWVRELRSLVKSGQCEFIGSGYSQVIGPLVPMGVNRHNQQIGLSVYEELLGVRPRIALVNEMAYSKGMVPIYREAGYETLIMEWDNVASVHPEWDREMRYFPQVALGPSEETINLVWAKSLAFQQFQRFVHGEQSLDRYLSYLSGHTGKSPRAFPLYTNDVEIFDYRPGRYHTEADLEEGVEWERIRRLMTLLKDDPRFEIVAPSAVLELLAEPNAGKNLRLDTPDLPIPVKKQGKYNALRWAVTGRNDLRANTLCWRIYERLMDQKEASAEDWKTLCSLWSSDYRTHITRKRWRVHQDQLERLAGSHRVQLPDSGPRSSGTRFSGSGAVQLNEDGPFLDVKTATTHIRFNTHRGMAIESLSFEGEQPLCGTLPHGFYHEIRRGADWYTGHVVFEGLGQPKVADLNPVKELIHHEEKDGSLTLKGTIDTPLGVLEKEFVVSGVRPAVSCVYRLKWPEVQPGRLRLGHVTLDPRYYDRTTLRYRTNNGGPPETHRLDGPGFDHGSAVSFLVSGTTCVGMTGGWLEIGDAERGLRITVDRSRSAVVGLVSFEHVDENSFFCRLSLSAKEIDDTNKDAEWPEGSLEFFMKLEPRPMG